MINVCWYEGIAGLYSHEGVHGRSRYACCGLLNDCLDQYDCEHFSGFSALPANAEGAVIIIHGGHLRHDVDKINQDASRLQWVIFVGIGDEESDFPYHRLWHRNFKLWMQSPIPGKSKADRFMVVGYPCDCREHLIHGQERIYDWSFAGQITHARREECVRELRKMTGGRLLETQQFYSGMEHAEYFKMLGQSKIVPCPSGPVCSDTFRLAEALEAGCIPILDEWPGWRDQPTTGFWKMVFPQGHPFIVASNWNQLPQMVGSILSHYEHYAKEAREFWASYKANYFSWLGKDLKALGVSI